MSAGVSISVNKQLRKPGDVLRTFDAPSKVHGRGCHPRLHGRHQAIVRYWLPMPKDVSSRASNVENLDSPTE